MRTIARNKVEHGKVTCTYRFPFRSEQMLDTRKKSSFGSGSYPIIVILVIVTIGIVSIGHGSIGIHIDITVRINLRIRIAIRGSSCGSNFFRYLINIFLLVNRNTILVLGNVFYFSFVGSDRTHNSRIWWWKTQPIGGNLGREEGKTFHNFGITHRDSVSLSIFFLGGLLRMLLAHKPKFPIQHNTQTSWQFSATYFGAAGVVTARAGQLHDWFECMVGIPMVIYYYYYYY